MGANRPKVASLDIVIPIFNEEPVLNQLFERLTTVFSKEALERHRISSARCLFIDDGSTDKSAQMIAARIGQGFPGVLLRLSRNFGHQNAVSAGMANTDADTVAIIDADLQDPPEVILEMHGVWRKGADVVFGERRKRKEGFVKVFCYWVYYRILAFLSEIPVQLDSGDFSLLDRRVIDALNNLPEKLRFPRGLRSWVGFTQVGYPYERVARAAGESKYSFRKLYYLATDGIASLSIRPLKLTQFLMVTFALISVCFFTLSLQRYLLYWSTGDRITLYFLAAYMLISAGTASILFCIYILSAYIGRIYLEVKNRPTFIIMERLQGHAASHAKSQVP